MSYGGGGYGGGGEGPGGGPGGGGFGGGGGSSGGSGGDGGGYGGGYGFGGMSVGPGQSGMSGFGGNLGGTGSFGGVSPGAASAAAGPAGFGGFGGAGFGGNGWGGLAGTNSTIGSDFGADYGLAGMYGYGLTADGNFGMLGGENTYGLSSYSPPAFGPQSTTQSFSLGDSFVADPQREENEKKKMLKSLVGPIAASVAPGPLGALAANTTSTALGLQSQDQMGKNMATNIAAMAGTAIGGPLGGVVGAALGRGMTAGGPTGARGPAGNSGAFVETPGGGIDWGGVGAGLAGIYASNKAEKAYKEAQQNSMGSVQQQLSDMFGPNSAYAQQLRQELERRDASSGRRSQYGPREVELQARLAEMASRAAPGMIGAATNQQQAAFQAAQAKQAQKNAQLNNLIQLGRATGAFDAIGRGVSSAAQNLGDMFGGGNQWGSGRDFGNYDLGENF